MPRKNLPISPRHRDDCTRPRECACPWSFRVRLPDGTMPRVTRDSYDDAEQAYHELLARRPEPLADRATTIAQWAARWLDMGTPQWRQNTVRNYRLDVSKRIVPGLGHCLVTGLRRDDVRLWVADMRRDGAGPTAMRTAITTLHAMYGAWLESDRLLPRGNPVDPKLAPKTARKEFTPLTHEQAAAWAAAMQPPDMALMVTTEAFYGARISEIRALREEDITFTGRDMGAPLAPQLARLAALPAARYEARRPQLRFARKLEVGRDAGPIKNRRGNRTLPFPQWLAAEYAAQLEQWPAVDGWLFTLRAAPGGHGRLRAGHPRPYLHQYCCEKYAVGARAAGITLPPGQCTHALRHHCVSVLRAKGWSDQDIGYWIGDDARTVAMVYGRPAADAMDRIAAMLSAGRDAPPLRAVD